MRRFVPRFGTRTLLFCMTAMAVVLGVGSALGWWLPLAVLYLALVVLPASALVTAAVYARGGAQAFFVGAAVGWYVVTEAMGSSWGLFRSPWAFVAMLVFPLAGGLAGGYVAVLTRRQVRRRGLDRAGR